MQTIIIGGRTKCVNVNYQMSIHQIRFNFEILFLFLDLEENIIKPINYRETILNGFNF